MPPPPPQICHSFKKTQKNDSDLTPPSLFARCHSFYRFFILKASLIKFVTFGLGRVGVKGNSDNVTEYDVFFFTASLRYLYKNLLLPGVKVELSSEEAKRRSDQKYQKPYPEAYYQTHYSDGQFSNQDNAQDRVDAVNTLINVGSLFVCIDYNFNISVVPK